MNYLDLFSGLGGFHLGLKQAGFKFKWTGFSEIDKYATQIYKRRFPDAEELGSIINIRPETLPKIDICTFGFPCQDLSVAGKRKGLSGQRSGLFFTAMRIIEVTKPEVFIFENVKGLFSSEEGRDFETVLRTVADLGIYECEWQLLNTRWFLPQNRERVYFIGHLRGKSRPKVFPFRESYFNAQGKRKGFKDGVRANVIDSNYFKGPDGKRTMIQIETKPFAWSKSHRTGKTEADKRRKKYGKIEHRIKTNEFNCLSTGEGCGNQSTQNFVKVGTLRTHKDGEGFRQVKDDCCPTIPARAREDGSGQPVIDVSPCIRAQHHNTADVHFIPEKSQIRRLTPTECERLQGFPDGYTEFGSIYTQRTHPELINIRISDTQRYKTLGNAVSVPVVKAIGERLLT